MKFKTLFQLIPILLFVWCSSTPKHEDAPAISEQSPEVSVQQRGFSLSFPNQEEWTVVNEDEYKIVLTKQGESSDELYTIQALVVKLPDFKGDE